MSMNGPQLPVYLGHIVNACTWIGESIDDMEKSKFSENRLLRESMMFNLQVIGEASKRIMTYPSFAEKHAGLDLTSPAKTRDVLVHHYDRIQFSVVWDTLVNNVPRLKQEVESILQTTSTAQFEQWEREKRS